MIDKDKETFSATQGSGRVRLAVYDFDGTCISGNSPVLLVGYLMEKGLLSFAQGFRIGLWALRYKFRLPENESLVRGLVFRPFCGLPASEVDDFLRRFYEEVVATRWRPCATESMRARSQEGCEVVVASATWGAIAERAMLEFPFAHVLATNMVIDSAGNYTCRVDGLPIEGEEKLHAVCSFADAQFGAGGWEISYAYGNHHSDIPLLSAAKQAFAVTPDKPLLRAARSRGWGVLDWDEPSSETES